MNEMKRRRDENIFFFIYRTHNQPTDNKIESSAQNSQETLAEKKNCTEKSESMSDCEDFFGFDADDLKNETVKEFENDVPIRDTGHSTNDAVDDEIIFIENNVEVIEIDDDDDDIEVISYFPTSEHKLSNLKMLSHLFQTAQAVQIKKETTKFSQYDIQRMLIANHPQIQLRKPELDWKSDLFRLVYINGEKQNLCTCTKCWELFDEINIDTVVRHARCNPAPSVSPCSKIRKMMDHQENAAVDETAFQMSVQNLTISKIQTIAACMDVQRSTFYQGNRFLKFGQFLIDTAASLASRNKGEFIYEPKNDFLCSFRDQQKKHQLSKISSILNTADNDFSLSCEVWEDIFRKKTNVSLELHYLDANFLRHRIVIGVKSINAVTIDDTIICEQILQMLRIYSSKNDGSEFLKRSTAFVTSRKFNAQSLHTVNFPSACSIINKIADEIVNEDRLKISEKCLHIIGWLNVVSEEQITVFDARKWENIYELFRKFNNKKASPIQLSVETTLPQDHQILQLLEPFHNAIVELSEAKNNITKVFGIYKLLEHSLMPLASDKKIVKSVKSKASAELKASFASSEAYSICMFLDPSNRDLYNSLESDKMDDLQSIIDIMIKPYMSTKENDCVENDLVHYMDDTVTSQPNQIDLFLQSQSTASNHDPYEFWRDNQQMPGLRMLARKYFTIPTYASLSECKFSDNAEEFLAKRDTVETKDIETMLMMNSSQCDVDRTNEFKISINC